MKPALLTVCLLIISVYAYSQGNSPASTQKHTIGMQFAPNYSNPDDNELLGFQYKRWVKPYVALRFNLMYGAWTDIANKEVLSHTNNKTRSAYYYDVADMFYLSAGAEVHKKVYKALHAYAALDLRGGYGTGSGQSVLATTYYPNPGVDTDPSVKHVPQADAYRVSRFMLDATPFVGVKVLLDKFGIGTEVSAISLSATGVNGNRPGYSAKIPVNLNTGLLRQRFFVNYRF